MYKAMVEIVSGTRLRADGKWLTCIGNKNVKIGDTIWTDGRCVYGNNLEAQTPFVITPQEKWGIPVQLGNYLFTFKRNGKLEQVGAISAGLTILNDYNKNVYSLRADAANCLNGDFFTLNLDSATLSSESKELEDIEHLPEIKAYIKKNYETQKEISLTNLLQNAVNQTYNEAKNIPYIDGLDDGVHDTGGYNPHCLITSYFDFHIRAESLYSFIENDTNWAFAFYVMSSFERSRIYSVDSRDAVYEFEVLDVIRDGYSTLTQIFYFDASGNNFVIYNEHTLNKYLDARPMWEHSLRNEDITRNVNFSEMQNVNFPIQDSYFFKANILPPEEYPISGYIPSVKYDIYSPNNNFLFSCQNLFGTYFSIYELAPNKYLVGINPNVFKGGADNIAGINICENGELKNIAENFKNSRCRNFILRPMKHSKNWWNKIKKLT